MNELFNQLNELSFLAGVYVGALVMFIVFIAIFIIMMVVK